MILSSLAKCKTFNLNGFNSEMNISRDEKTMVLKKLCENIVHLEPHDLPTLSFQLFSMCTNAAQVIIPIFSLNNYFHRNYYKKVFGEMCSEQTNLDSIGEQKRKLVVVVSSNLSSICRGIQREGAARSSGHRFVSSEHMHRIQNQ